LSKTSVCQAGKIDRKKITGPGYDAGILIDNMNRRIKIINYQGLGLASLIQRLESLTKERNIGKIIFTCPEEFRFQAEQSDFILEGEIPGFFKGKKALCYSFYTQRERAKSEFTAKEDKIIQEVTCDTDFSPDEIALPGGCQIRQAEQRDVDKLVSLYREVFVSYPSPLLEPEYVSQVMKENVYFLVVYKDEELISAGSAEIDYKNANAEITDLATSDKARGMGLATIIISDLEKEMWQRKLKCLYSLARAGVPGVNRVFFKLGYQYYGRMTNNCHIGGRYEDMNIWVKGQSKT